jgi:hypothetical protein
MPILDNPRVLCLLPKDSDGSLLWRHWFPINEIQTHGIICDWTYVEDFIGQIKPRLESGKYNVVVTPRFTFREAWMLKYFVQLLHEYNIAWVYELDDDMISENIVPRQVAYWMQSDSYKDFPEEQRREWIRVGNEYARQARLQYLKLVDAVTVSTPALASLVEQYTEAPILIVPNTMDLQWFTDRVNRTERVIGPITVGWSGGWRYDEDLTVLSQAWAGIAQRYEDVQFVINGYVSPSLLASVPSQRMNIIEWSDIEVYPSRLKNIDIGCCSVADIDWNKCKSAIKWYEMSVCGAACVASHALYGDEITDGINGLLATSAQEWELQIAKLIVDGRLRRSIQRNAVSEVDTYHNIKYTWPKWLHAWRTALRSHSDNPERAYAAV